MRTYRQAARIDDNQAEIVKQLRKLGVSVDVGHDDILCGYQGRTYWYEIKDPAKALNKNGDYAAGTLKPSQIRLIEEWKGHYLVVHCIEQILEDIGIKTEG